MKIINLSILLLLSILTTCYGAAVLPSSGTATEEEISSLLTESEGVESETVAPSVATIDRVDDDDFILPEGLQTCRRDDPELNQCIRNSINQQLPLLHKGSKVLNIPPLDPLKIPDGRYGYSSGPVGGTLILKGVNVYGASKASVKKSDTKVFNDGIASVILIFFPRLLIEGNYKAEVKINELKMRPKGYFNLTLSDITVKAKMIGKYETINDKKHLQLKQIDVEPEIGDLKIFATGIFPDPALNNVVLDFANQYWPEFVKTVVPQTRPTWEPIVLDIANKFLGTVPFDKLLVPKSN